MHFDFDDDQRAFRDAIRGILAAECPPEVVRAAYEGDRTRADRAWRALADAGTLGLLAPESTDGLALGMVDAVMLFEEAGRSALPAPFVDTVAVAVPLLAELDAARVAPIIAGGAACAALDADALLAYPAACDVALLGRGDALYAVPHPAEHCAPQTSVDRATPLAVPPDDPDAAWLVAQGPHVSDALDAAFDRGAVGTAAVLVGLAQRMLDMTAEYAKVRTQFGRPIGGFQSVKHMLADAYTAIAFARPCVARAARAIDDDEPDAILHVSTAKALASDAADRTAKLCLQAHGAIGYTTEYDLHLYMKRAWVDARRYGDAAWHRARAAELLLDGDALPARTDRLA